MLRRTANARPCPRRVASRARFLSWGTKVRGPAVPPGRARSAPTCSRRRVVLAFLAACAAAPLPLARTAPLAAQEGTGVGPPLGSAAPDAQVEDLDGEPVSLSALIGDRAALLEFWASWCENCEALAPQMAEIHERFSDRLAVVAVAVAVGQSRRRVRRHVDAHAPAFPFVYDAGGDAVRAFGALSTSVVVLLDADGTVAFTGVGPDQDLLGAVETLLGGS